MSYKKSYFKYQYVKKKSCRGGEYGSSNCMYGSEKEMINMANKVNTTSKLILKVYKGDEKNPDATVQRTFSHINLSRDPQWSQLWSKYQHLDFFPLLSFTQKVVEQEMRESFR